MRDQDLSDDANTGAKIGFGGRLTARWDDRALLPLLPTVRPRTFFYLHQALALGDE